MRSIEYVDKQDRDQKYYVSTTWLIKDNMCTLAHMPMISKAHTFGKDVQAFAAQSGRPNLPGRARSAGLDPASRCCSSKRPAGRPGHSPIGRVKLNLSIGYRPTAVLTPPTKSKKGERTIMSCQLATMLTLMWTYETRRGALAHHQKAKVIRWSESMKT